jgi:hypothetical protein
MPEFNKYYGILVVLFFILAFVIAGLCTIKPCGCSKLEPYENISRYFDHLKKHKQIGEPCGVLSVLEDQDDCQSKHNLLVQPNVTFKPFSHDSDKKDCSYIQMRYPG